MKALITYADEAYYANLSGAPGPDVGRGVGLAVALAGMQTVQSICQHHFFYRSMMVGAMARSALIGVIYRKSLVLSNKVPFPYSSQSDFRLVWSLRMVKSQISCRPTPHEWILQRDIATSRGWR